MISSRITHMSGGGKFSVENTTITGITSGTFWDGDTVNVSVEPISTTGQPIRVQPSGVFTLEVNEVNYITSPMTWNDSQKRFIGSLTFDDLNFPTNGVDLQITVRYNGDIVDSRSIDYFTNFPVEINSTLSFYDMAYTAGQQAVFYYELLDRFGNKMKTQSNAAFSFTFDIGTVSQIIWQPSQSRYAVLVVLENPLTSATGTFTAMRNGITPWHVATMRTAYVAPVSLRSIRQTSRFSTQTNTALDLSGTSVGDTVVLFLSLDWQNAGDAPSSYSLSGWTSVGSSNYPNGYSSSGFVGAYKRTLTSSDISNGISVAVSPTDIAASMLYYIFQDGNGSVSVVDKAIYELSFAPPATMNTQSGGLSWWVHGANTSTTKQTFAYVQSDIGQASATDSYITGSTPAAASGGSTSIPWTVNDYPDTNAGADAGTRNHTIFSMRIT